MELHDRIYQLRKEKNMTQQDLADRLGVSRQAVSRWEMGTAKPETENLTTMSRIFGITVDELLTGEKPVAAEPATKRGPNPGKWVRVWLFTWLAVVALCLIRLFVQWKVMGLLVAVVPLTLAVQLVNIGLELGIVFIAVYWVVKLWKRK